MSVGTHDDAALTHPSLGAASPESRRRWLQRRVCEAHERLDLVDEAISDGELAAVVATFAHTVCGDLLSLSLSLLHFFPLCFFFRLFFPCQ